MVLKFADFKEKYSEASRAFVDEFGKRIVPYVAFLDSSDQLRAVWQGEVETMISVYRDSTWSEPEDVWGDSYTPEIEEALSIL